MAKIAAAVEQAVELRRRLGAPGGTSARVLARGDGWSVADVVCTAGPDDRPFEEAHGRATIAIVVAGTFRYRSPAGRELMTPGSLMLGSAGQPFECGHEHGEGDRCVSFWYAPDLLERLAFDAGGGGAAPALVAGRVPPLRALAPLVTHAVRGLVTADALAWEELGVSLAATAVRLAGPAGRDARCPLNAETRVARVVRAIDHAIGDVAGAPLTLGRLAQAAGLSPYHFLRTFQQVTGVTPHQYILRARLRHAAVRLADEPALRIVDSALDAGFGDVSNFNRAFRAEFGVSPRAYRQSGGGRPSLTVGR